MKRIFGALICIFIFTSDLLALKCEVEVILPKNLKYTLFPIEDFGLKIINKEKTPIYFNRRNFEGSYPSITIKANKGYATSVGCTLFESSYLAQFETIKIEKEYIFTPRTFKREFLEKISYWLNNENYKSSNELELSFKINNAFDFCAKGGFYKNSKKCTLKLTREKAEEILKFFEEKEERGKML